MLPGVISAAWTAPACLALCFTLLCWQKWKNRELTPGTVTRVDRGASLDLLHWRVMLMHQTFLVVTQIWLLSWNSRGAFPTTVWKQKWCREENQMPASPAVWTGLCKWKHLRTPSKGMHAHLKAGGCIAGRMDSPHTLWRLYWIF